MIDSHAHLDFKEFDKDRAEVIQRAFANGVKKIINVGCNLERSKASIELAEKYRNIFASVGCHPHDVDIAELSIVNRELRKLTKSDKVVAIGECGLDYFRLENEKDKENQQKLFRTQIKLAKEMNLPLIIHCRDAYDDLLDILQSFDLSEKPGVAHCFLGNLSEAERLLDLGFYISFTGVITFPKAEKTLEVVKKISLDRILIETDCPYLAPVPKRGDRNEPVYVRYVAEKIAEVRDIDIEKVEKATANNTMRLFGI